MTYLDDQFAQYTTYCDASSNETSSETSSATATTTTAPSIPLSYLSLIPTLAPTVADITQLSGGVQTMTVYINATVTSTLPAYFVHLSIDSLISSYLPADVLSGLAAAAPAATLALAGDDDDDPTSLIYSALEATSPPEWLAAAVPVTYAAQMSTLEASIDAIRAAAVSGSPIDSGNGQVTGTTVPIDTSSKFYFFS